jgi:hypothetical protein
MLKGGDTEAMTDTTRKEPIVSAHTKDYDLFIVKDVATVTTDRAIVTKQRVEGLSEFVAAAKDLKIGWGAFPDFEVIYIYDKEDENFGYGLNLQAEDCSEWGYAPFSS